MVQRITFLLLLLQLLVIPFPCSGALIPVKYKEGTAHGFLVLRSQDGKLLATGELIQTVEGDRVTSEIVFHFRDGSIHDETTVFSEKSEFRLISDHLRQQGPSFPKPIDATVDVSNNKIETFSDKASKQKHDVQHLQIPEDTANGLILVLSKNLSPSAAETTVSMVATGSKARVLKLKIHTQGEETFSAAGVRIRATHYVAHPDLGPVTGAIAAAVGKDPSDLHFWIVTGKAPALIKFMGQLYESGPIWNIELAPVRSITQGTTAQSR